MPRRRHPNPSLSAAERRVLDAFSCGRLSAGRLSEALAAARQEPSIRAMKAQPHVVAVEQPAVQLQLAA